MGWVYKITLNGWAGKQNTRSRQLDKEEMTNGDDKESGRGISSRSKYSNNLGDSTAEGTLPGAKKLYLQRRVKRRISLTRL
jgi:hypothetical protein